MEFLIQTNPDFFLGARADSSGMTMVVDGLDMNYMGVSSVWSNDLGSSSATLFTVECH